MKETKLLENISGNYNTTSEEEKAVITFLNKHNVPYREIHKYSDPNAGDIMVRFENNMYSLFEVKRESIERISKYNEYGIDFISSLIFKDKDDLEKWKGLHNPNEFNSFMSKIDYTNPHFKWGKIYYSYADVWLFYCKDNKGNYNILEGYSGKK